MEQAVKQKLDISTILTNILAIVFLCYVAWMLCNIGAYMRAVAVYALMMPKFISIWRAFRRICKITDLEQWVFNIIAIICWLLQSAMTGKLHHLIAMIK